MALTYIKVFIDTLDLIEPLNNEERGRLFTALLEYARTGETLAAEGNERFLFPVLKAQLDREAVNYEKMCETSRANGRLGGRPKKNPAGFSETQDKENDKDKNKDKDKDKDYLLGGAARPAQKRPYHKSRGPAPRPASPETVRAELADMERYLEKLRAGEC